MPGGSPCGRCCRRYSSRRYSRRRLDWSRAHHAARVREMRQRAPCSASGVGPGCGLARRGCGSPRRARVPVCGVGARTDVLRRPKEAHTVARGVPRHAGGSGCRRGPARAGPARACAGAGVGPARVVRAWASLRPARVPVCGVGARTDGPRRPKKAHTVARGGPAASGPVGTDAPTRPAKCADEPTQPAEVSALASSSMMITALISAR